MAKKYSFKFWVIFWLISAIFLTGWFFFWRYQHQGYLGIIRSIQPVVNVLPIEKEKKEQLDTMLKIIDSFSEKGEQTFLLLFQNNHELRPGGGYIGSFGILKTYNDKITSIDTHDTNVFDSGASTGIKPPYPMELMLNIKDWELRDSNWSGDFPTNAKRAERFYHLESGKEEFDGVIAVSTEILKSLLEITGPIKLKDYPGEYNSENVIDKLQYQVEQAYWKQGIERGKRKYVMKDLSKVIAERLRKLNLKEKKQLAQKIEQHFKDKDILVYFKDEALENEIRSLDWDGEVEKTIENNTTDIAGDYLMVLDANLGSLKSDPMIKRSFEYQVDFRQKRPLVKLKLNYTHLAKQQDWRTRDYDVYTKVLVPQGSWLNKIDQAGEVRFEEELGKKVFAFIHQVKLGQEKTVVLNYELPEKINEGNYQMLIQKQSGLGTIPGKIKIIFSNGEEKVIKIDLRKKWRLKELEIPSSGQIVIKD